jgi:predicted SAM-dependent methyltransferase
MSLASHLKQRLPKPVKRRLQRVLVGVAQLPPTRALYARKLRRLAAAAAPRPVCLHLGCGARHLAGWINVDRVWDAPMPDVVLDLRRPIPLPDGSVDLIFSEDFLEHIEHADGRALLEECARVLKPGGVLRLLTPNLRTLAQAYLEGAPGELAWYRREFGCETPAEVMNTAMRAWGHRFLHDEDSLSGLLAKAGLEPRRRAHDESDEALLCGLDLRTGAEGVHSMAFDCTKPRATSAARAGELCPARPRRSRRRPSGEPGRVGRD